MLNVFVNCEMILELGLGKLEIICLISKKLKEKRLIRWCHGNSKVINMWFKVNWYLIYL